MSQLRERHGVRIAVTTLVTGLLAGLLAWSGAPASARLAEEYAARQPAARTAVVPKKQAAVTRCSRRNARPFLPRRATVGVLGSRRVFGVSRVAGLPGTPPLTDTGKVLLGWDRVGIRPGFSHGHVLMNAHAWPDGTALGNGMNAKLRLGSVIRVYGRGGRVQCYRVFRHVVKAPSLSLERLYYGDDKSPARLAILTCAGVRRGPGDWSKRAVWLAKPVP